MICQHPDCAESATCECVTALGNVPLCADHSSEELLTKRDSEGRSPFATWFHDAALKAGV